jgi:hypothetical protein
MTKQNAIMVYYLDDFLVSLDFCWLYRKSKKLEPPLVQFWSLGDWVGRSKAQFFHFSWMFLVVEYDIERSMEDVTECLML